MEFNVSNYEQALVDMEQTVAAGTSDWRSTLVLRYTEFLTTQVNQRQANLNVLMARTGLTLDVMAMRQPFHDAEQAEINSIKAQLGSISEVTSMIADPIATEAMLRIYTQAGGI